MRPAVKGVGSLADLNLREGIDDVATLGVGEPENRLALGFQAESRSPLPLGAYPDIGDDLLHSRSGWPVKNSLGLIT